MHVTSTPNPPSVAEILHALILALIPFIDSLLADPASAQSPALRRLARTLRALRAVAALFGTPAALPPIPSPATPHPRRRQGARTADATRRHIRARAAAASARHAGITPEPTRTLEL